MERTPGAAVAIGFSMKQLIILVWLEQALVIVVGLALGTWMGGRLGAIIMPFLGNDDSGGEVLPPFVLEGANGFRRPVLKIRILR